MTTFIRKTSPQAKQTETQHTILVGDSIIDNQPYVKQGHTVTDYLNKKLPDNHQVTRLAIDGHTTKGALLQLENIPKDASSIIISIGGNDALGYAGSLSNAATTLAHAFEQFSEILQRFKYDYLLVINKALSFNVPITVMTIYNDVPGLGIAEQTALGLFNETILDVALGLGLRVIDLRHVCNQEEDYSLVSPIEPSEIGSDKITDAIIVSLGLADTTAHCSQRAITYS